MSQKSRMLLFSAAGLLLVAGLAVWAIYGAVHGEPAFYQQAVKREPMLAEKSSDEFLQQAAAAASDVRKPGRWDAVFTADQVNGWLAVDMARNFPGLLPDTFSDPRVAIRPGDITLACRYDGPEVRAVLTISCDLYLSAANTVALRIKGARCGLMPLPLGKVLEAISHTARQLELPLEWRRSGGDPVALLSMSVLSDHLNAHHHVELDTLELRDGELFVAGRTEHGSRGPTAALAAPPLTAAGLPAATGMPAATGTPAAALLPESVPPSSSSPSSTAPSSTRPVEVADTRLKPVKTADSIKPAEPLPLIPLEPLPPAQATEPNQRPASEPAEPAATTGTPASTVGEDQPSIAAPPKNTSQR